MTEMWVHRPYSCEDIHTQVRIRTTYAQKPPNKKVHFKVFCVNVNNSKQAYFINKSFHVLIFLEPIEATSCCSSLLLLLSTRTHNRLVIAHSRLRNHTNRMNYFPTLITMGKTIELWMWILSFSPEPLMKKKHIHYVNM